MTECALFVMTCGSTLPPACTGSCTIKVDPTPAPIIHSHLLHRCIFPDMFDAAQFCMLPCVSGLHTPSVRSCPGTSDGWKHCAAANAYCGVNGCSLQRSKTRASSVWYKASKTINKMRAVASGLDAAFVCSQQVIQCRGIHCPFSMPSAVQAILD